MPVLITQVNLLNILQPELLLEKFRMETNMELAWRRENTIFKMFICPTQRQHLQDTTKPSKPLKE